MISPTHHLDTSSARSIRAFRAVLIAGLLCTAGSVLKAQNNPADDTNRRRRGNGNTAAADDNANGRRGGLNPQDMMARLRERLEITDDEEWKVVSERLNKVMELRRTGGGFGGFGGRGPQGGNADTNGGNRGGRGASTPEMAALQSAVRDNLPEAEIKSRLERLREVRKENDAKLVKAQEELRAVLSLKQEANAVMFGLLP